MTAVSKSRQVLEYQSIYPDGLVKYGREPDDVSDRPASITFDRGLYEDLGMPTKITVTIRPGDRLNK